MPSTPVKARKSPLYCAFCGRNKDEVEMLVASSLHCICSDCVDLCVSVVQEERQARIARKSPVVEVDQSKLLKHSTAESEGAS